MRDAEDALPGRWVKGTWAVTTPASDAKVSASKPPNRCPCPMFLYLGTQKTRRLLHFKGNHIEA
jgi:hypothetical protein